PLTSGLIIAASVLVAAGIAIYESPQVRQWVDQSRRKIAIALHSLGDEFQPRRGSESSEDFEARRRKEETLRRRRNELIRRAREEGVAVDLDELSRIGREEEMVERRPRRQGSGRSFDDLVGSDGMLRKDNDTAGTTTGTEPANKDLRRRGFVGFAAGAAAANPFADDHQVRFDHDDDEAPSPMPFKYVESRESSATVQGDILSPSPISPPSAQLIDLTPEPEPTEQAAQSFYSFTSEDSHAPVLVDEDSEAENISTGTLTPRSERSFFTNASVVPSHADDIAILSTQSDDDHDARSEAFSEGGFTDAGFSEIGSDAGHDSNLGVMTPSSWTDVGSDDESEWGGPAQGGQVSQMHQ
ncbi:hypothetical protein BDV96DRAFT_482885, partial [Lophiotrema nucula]